MMERSTRPASKWVRLLQLFDRVTFLETNSLPGGLSICMSTEGTRDLNLSACGSTRVRLSWLAQAKNRKGVEYVGNICRVDAKEGKCGCGKYVLCSSQGFAGVWDFTSGVSTVGEYVWSIIINMMGPLFEPWCPKPFPTSSVSQLVYGSRSAVLDCMATRKGHVPMCLLLRE